MKFLLVVMVSLFFALTSGQTARAHALQLGYLELQGDRSVWALWRDLTALCYAQC